MAARVLLLERRVGAATMGARRLGTTSGRPPAATEAGRISSRAGAEKGGSRNVAHLCPAQHVAAAAAVLPLRAPGGSLLAIYTSPPSLRVSFLCILRHLPCGPLPRRGAEQRSHTLLHVRHSAAREHGARRLSRKIGPGKSERSAQPRVPVTSQWLGFVDERTGSVPRLQSRWPHLVTRQSNHHLSLPKGRPRSCLKRDFLRNPRPAARLDRK